MNHPLVTICVPVFNAEGSIGRCLDAVLAQDTEEAEILIVDNASDDRTASIAEHMLRGIPQARIIRNERNIGRIENWNRCLELATGRYIKFALANDALLKSSLRIMLDEAQSNPETVMVGSKFQYEDVFPLELPEMPAPVNVKRYSTVETLQFFGEETNTTGSLNGTLFKREPIVNNNLHFRLDMPYCADFYFAIQLACYGQTAFLDVNSHLFNATAKSRFHYAGMNAANLVREHRECALEIARLLRIHGGDESCAFKGLWHIYEVMFYNQRPFSIQESHQIFAGSGAYQSRALINRVRYELKKALPFLVPAARKLRTALRTHE